MQIIFAAVVRGQGETQGFHERRIQVPEPLRLLFKGKSAPVDMARIAQDRVSDAARVSKALRSALFALYQAAPEKLDFNDPKAKRKAEFFIAQFDQAVDEDFFEHLFEEMAEPVGSESAVAYRKRWIELIWQRARHALATAEAGSPLSGVRRFRSRAAAKGLLDGAIINAFPDHLKRKPAA